MGLTKEPLFRREAFLDLLGLPFARPRWILDDLGPVLASKRSLVVQLVISYTDLLGCQLGLLFPPEAAPVRSLLSGDPQKGLQEGD